MRRRLLLAAAIPVALKVLDVAGRVLRSRGRSGTADQIQRLHDRIVRYRRR